MALRMLDTGCKMHSMFTYVCIYIYTYAHNACTHNVYIYIYNMYVLDYTMPNAFCLVHSRSVEPGAATILSLHFLKAAAAAGYAYSQCQRLRPDLS